MRLKQLAIMFLSIVLVMGSLPVTVLAKDDASADTQKGKYDTKDESIYGDLDALGSLKDMYVVNTFDMEKPGIITDYGDYTDVRNLTNLTDVEQDDSDVRFQAEKGDEDFHYQGYLENKPLPWDIDITYLLDGEEMDPDELAGQDGSLEIQIETSANDDVDKTFFENYMMQISLALDPTIFDDIQAPDATKAKEGKDTNLTFTVMPEKEETFIVSAEVTDLEMDPIDINATPASMPIDDPDLGDMKGDMQSLSDGIQDVNEGVGDLSDGVSDLNDGAEELSDGSSDYQNGMNELDSSSGELVNGSKEILSTLNQVSDAVDGDIDIPDLGEFQEFPEHLYDLSDGLGDVADGLGTLRDNYDDAYNQLKGMIDDIPDGALTEEDIEQLRESGVDDDIVDQLLETYEKAQTVKEAFPELDHIFGSVKGTLDQTYQSMQEMAGNVDEMAGEIENGMDDMDDMDGLDALGDLQDGLTTMASEYQSFHNGLVDYTDGVSELASSYAGIDEGIDGLADGSSSLDEGTNDLKEGTQELHEETSDLPGEMQSEMDEMLDEYDASDFEPVSFVSDKNKDVDVVQFILQTEKIEVDEPDTTEDTTEEEDKSMWDRFLDLFRSE